MYGKRTRTDHAGTSASTTDAATPGKATLIDGLVQRRAAPGGEGGTDAEVQAAASEGITGPAQALPHLDSIQRAFGDHDVSGVRAHVGGAAANASAEIGARAYATGGEVAFAGHPDLHTAAHEAAHVVQQRGGVQLAGGVGAEGDVYERHADQVADAVVAGRSAAAILDDMAPSGPSGPPVQRAVQRRTDMEVEAREMMRERRDAGDDMIKAHKDDPAGLASAILQDISTWEGTQAAYRVFERAPNKAALFAALAAQLPNPRLVTLRAAGNGFTDSFLMSLPRHLREAGNITEAERLIGVLVDPEHAHLVGEQPSQSPAVQGALGTHNASLQSISGGAGPIVYDYYWVVMDSMPATVTPDGYLTEMSNDLNAAVHNESFDRINVFKRTQQDVKRGAPAVGDVYDIDILGPDNGSVMLVERTPSHFIFQTVTTKQTGTHPESGSREFGYEPADGGGVKFYTRGASRPGSEVAGMVGAPIQERGWTSMLQGIGAALQSRGGKMRPGSFGHWIKRG